MKLKEDNIDIYNNSALILNNKTPNFINSWIIILIILNLLFIVISFIPFNIYSTYNGLVISTDEESYISLNLEKSDFPINKNNKLYIKNDYNYPIQSGEEQNILVKMELKKIRKLKNNMNVGEAIIYLGDKKIHEEKIYVKIKEEKKDSFFTKFKKWIGNLW